MKRRAPRRVGNRLLSRLICILGVAVGRVFLSTASAAEPVLVVDATADPGVALLITFVPQGDVADGIRRVAGHQSVVTTAPVRLSAVLPAYWLVSVLKTGDVVPNISTIPISSGSGYRVFVFPGQVTVTLDDGEWQIPHYDSTRYAVDVGFGLGSEVVQPAYTVRCRPGQRLRMVPGNYQLVRSDGDSQAGTPIKPGLDAWDIPANADSMLTFDARGEGTLSPLH